uniref:Putative secreted protein n=1 Tax=Anopheles triannulatus TaxID=58253 RepID=A0A2M4B3K0_9DIPT
MRGRSFFITTFSCISSSVGCGPSSLSNGNRYSSTGPPCTVHRDTNSQRTSPHAYTSMRRKASRVKLIAPSSTSGAM